MFFFFLKKVVLFLYCTLYLKWNYPDSPTDLKCITLNSIYILSFPVYLMSSAIPQITWSKHVNSVRTYTEIHFVSTGLVNWSGNDVLNYCRPWGSRSVMKTEWTAIKTVQAVKQICVKYSLSQLIISYLWLHLSVCYSNASAMETHGIYVFYPYWH